MNQYAFPMTIYKNQQNWLVAYYAYKLLKSNSTDYAHHVTNHERYLQKSIYTQIFINFYQTKLSLGDSILIKSIKYFFY
jgi:hypothetical protein